MENFFDLTGKTAVINGGASTLGSAMALGLAKHGATIALVGRNAEKLKKMEEYIHPYADVRSFVADVTDEQALQQAAKDIVDWTGTFHILLNAPGKNSSTPFFELDMEEWDDIMSVNLKGMVQSCQIFSRKMIDLETKGSIINISSVSTIPPLSKVITYSASKAGVNSVTQYLARELAPYGIRVNAIIPGFFPAEQNRKILTEERTNAIMSQTPLNRFGEPEELQGATVWLASDQAAGFVTGALIPVDGGFTSMKF